MYSLVIFDMDGTMIDSEAKWAKAWRIIGNKYGYDFGIDFFAKLVGISGQPVLDIISNYTGYHNPQQIVDEAYSLGLELIEKEGIDPKPGIIQILDYLDNKGIKKAIATTTKRELAKQHLDRLDLFDRFDYIICGDEVKNRKPHPEIYQRVLEKMEFGASEALVLEDSPYGVMSAYNAKIDCLMIPDIVLPTNELIQMVKCIKHSLNDVIDYFEEDQ